MVMKKNFLLVGFIAFFGLQFCTTSKKALSGTNKNMPMVSYENDISPIIKSRCSPCHFPPEGNKETHDTYEAVKANIDDELLRVQLPHDDPKFMPFKMKKEPLSDSLIQVFKLWKQQEMPI